jgi:hypothetical protein
MSDETPSGFCGFVMLLAVLIILMFFVGLVGLAAKFMLWAWDWAR